GAAWLMFELVPTKLPHYILPVYPALALLAAGWIAKPAASAQTSRARGLRLAACVQFMLAAMAIAAVPLFLPQRLGGALAWWVLTGACSALGAAIAASVALLRRRMRIAISFAA